MKYFTIAHVAPTYRAAALAAASALMVLSGCSSSVSNMFSTDSAMQAEHVGVVSDWSQRHLIFPNPGTEEDAMASGRHSQWLSIVHSSRYNMQQLLRGSTVPSGPVDGRPRVAPMRQLTMNPSPASDGKWTVPLTTSTPGGATLDMYPAKFSFAPVGTPDCTNDFVVFPINVAGSTTQANIIGLNQLYSGAAPACGTTGVPHVRFAYNVGTGTVRTSPIISLDGKKIAFIESIATGSKFHVITLDSPTASGNGTSSTAPVAPGTGNAARDISFVISGSAMNTDSSPFIDYDKDIAYVGDDIGELHKITGVFNGTPAEVTTSPWPITIVAANPTGLLLTGAVYDQVSGRIFAAGRNTGALYCVVAATGQVCPNSGVNLGTGIQDAPIVDGTNQTVFIINDDIAGSSGHVTVNQINTALASGSLVVANFGVGGSDQYNGAFDNAYYTSPSTGHYYVCGAQASTAQPTLYRIGFNSAGKMNGSPDSTSDQIVVSGSGTSVDCSPLTEAFNPTKGQDLLFFSVKNGGYTSLLGLGLNGPNCGVGIVLPTASPCIITVDITASAFPSAALATSTSSSGSSGTSGFIIDNVSTSTGASQIYFGDLTNGLGTQLSQGSLQ